MTAIGRTDRVANAMTVDVEDWFQVENYKDAIRREAWDGLASRVEANTDRLLARFAEAGTRATFFTLGWVAQRHGPLVRRIVAAGHELASHGQNHDRVAAIGEAAFRADILEAKRRLEDAGGVAVTGYRAPTFSIGPRLTPWAHAVLAETGHRYSSSVFPGRHAARGEGALPLVPFRPHPDGVPEIPMTALPLAGKLVPVSGGGWFRLMPLPVFAALLRRVNQAGGRPGMFYLHPWEIDPGQPRVAGISALKQVKHRLGLAAVEGRLVRLLRGFAWDRVDVVFAAAIGAPAQGAARPAPVARAA
jgi:polysaccharide deacetylase family protein (PEP-CTERM system associated)